MSKCKQQYYGKCAGNRPSQCGCEKDMGCPGMVPPPMPMTECGCKRRMAGMYDMSSDGRGYWPNMGMAGTSDCYDRDYRRKDGCDKKRCYVNNNMPDFALAMAYVPWQPFQNIFEDEEAFQEGTIFADLNLEYCGRRCD